MKYLRISASALLIFAWCTSSASAQQYTQQGQYEGQYGPSLMDFWKASYRDNQRWPRQYVPASRRAVHGAYAAMVNNGWRRQNLLGSYHFDSDSGELTHAGKLKVKWILTQAPQHRRSIFVERGPDQSETAARVASIHDWASSMRPSVGAVDINDTHIVAEGHPAGSVYSTFVSFQTNQPAAALPSGSSSSESSGE